MVSKQVNYREKLIVPLMKKISSSLVDIKGRIAFLILMFWPVFLIKPYSLFLDEAIYMEFQALCQVNIGNLKKKLKTQITLNVSLNYGSSK
jgi:hypothetical protein